MNTPNARGSKLFRNFRKMFSVVAFSEVFRMLPCVLEVFAVLTLLCDAM